jgi:hypothetical protein
MEESEIKNKGGRPRGYAMKGKYGVGRKTKVVRVPVEVADNIAPILASFDAIRAMVDDWDERVESAGERSTTGRPSPRYERALQLLQELREYLD